MILFIVVGQQEVLEGLERQRWCRVQELRFCNKSLWEALGAQRSYWQQFQRLKPIAIGANANILNNMAKGEVERALT